MHGTCRTTLLTIHHLQGFPKVWTLELVFPWPPWPAEVRTAHPASGVLIAASQCWAGLNMKRPSSRSQGQFISGLILQSAVRNICQLCVQYIPDSRELNTIFFFVGFFYFHVWYMTHTREIQTFQERQEAFLYEYMQFIWNVSEKVHCISWIKWSIYYDICRW